MKASSYDAFAAKVRKISKLNSISALLRWDQETYLPRRGAEDRADQLAVIASMAHEELVGKEMEDLLGALPEGESSAELPLEARVNVREIRRSFERERKLPADLVEEISRAQSQGFQAWAEACDANDFAKFEPSLKRSVELQRRAAELYGYRDDIYNAMLDIYEPGTTVAQIDPLFRDLKERIVPLLESIEDAQRRYLPVDAHGPAAPVERQADFAQQIARDMGFDFEAGRMDRSAHPFTTSLSPRDVRLTVHYTKRGMGSTGKGRSGSIGVCRRERLFRPEWTNPKRVTGRISSGAAECSGVMSCLASRPAFRAPLTV
jgi:carboxypeptidase Taq